MSSRPPAVSRPSVVAVVLAAASGDAAASTEATIAAVRAQVYEPDQVVTIDPGTPGGPATEDAPQRFADATSLVSGLDRERDFVWFVQAGAVPRPGALGALVAESQRLGAGIVGSKVVADDDRLLEVGMATDVFGVPYAGLDTDEIDAGQFDVVRDVAWVSTVSMLVRRDLLIGLGGPDPDLAPLAAAMDLCQRARLRGARVVVAPAAVVVASDSAVDDSPWRERAGQLRAIGVAYSALTLLWVLPLRFVIGLLEAIVAPFVGRWALFSWVASWTWFVGTLGSTVRRRNAVRQGSPAPDEELFRFQVSGSARLRTVGAEIGRALRDRLPSDDRYTLTSLGRDLRRPAVLAGVVTVGFAVTATRVLWSGFPTAGTLAPLGPSAGEALSAYAGGWNPAGLGSAHPVEPFVGAMGVIQWLTLGSPTLATGVVALGSVVAAVWGMVRLLRRWGIDTVPAMAAGVVLIAGPASRALAGETAFEVLAAAALLPWAVRAMTARWPDGWWPRIGQLAVVGLSAGLVAVFAPLVVAVAIVSVVLWMVFVSGRGRLVAGASIGIAVGVGIVVLRPWIDSVDVQWYLQDGSAFWEPGVIVLAFLGLAALGAIVFAPGALARVAAWGSAIGIIGAIVARLDEVGVGREPELAGLAAVAFGSALVVGAALEGASRGEFLRGELTRVGVGVAAAAALVVVGSALVVVIGGRLGLPGGDYRDMVRFIAAGLDPGEARVLVLGHDPSLPGEQSDIDGAAYRLVDAPAPRLASVRAVPPGQADAALEAALREITAGSTQRAGGALAPFGVRWIIVASESPFTPLLNRQLDLQPLTGLNRDTFVSDVAAARAVSADGEPWAWDGRRYTGIPSSRVVIGETADSRWGPGPWEAVEWANSVSASSGVAEFAPNPARRQSAQVALVVMALLSVIAIVARRRS